jgi:hypothetical protein
VQKPYEWSRLRACHHLVVEMHSTERWNEAKWVLVILKFSTYVPPAFGTTSTVSLDKPLPP